MAGEKDLSAGIVFDGKEVIKKRKALDEYTRGEEEIVVISSKDKDKELGGDELADELLDNFTEEDFKGPMSNFGMHYPGELKKVQSSFKRNKTNYQEEEYEDEPKRHNHEASRHSSQDGRFAIVKKAILDSVKDLKDDIEPDWFDIEEQNSLVVGYCYEKYSGLFSEEEITKTIQLML